MSWYRQTHWQVLAALVLGLVYGLVAGLSGWDGFTSDWIAPFGHLFLNFLKLIAVPLVFSTLILGVASLGDVRKLSRIGMRTIGIFVALSLLASLIAVALTSVVRPGAGFSAEMRGELLESYGGPSGATTDSAAGLRSGSPLQALVDQVRRRTSLKAGGGFGGGRSGGVVRSHEVGAHVGRQVGARTDQQRDRHSDQGGE